MFGREKTTNYFLGITVYLLQIGKIINFYMLKNDTYYIG